MGNVRYFHTESSVAQKSGGAGCILNVVILQWVDASALPCCTLLPSPVLHSVCWCLLIALAMLFKLMNSAWLQYASEVSQGDLFFPVWSLCSHLMGFSLQEICKHNNLKMSFGSGQSNTRKKILSLPKEILPWQQFR